MVVRSVSPGGSSRVEPLRVAVAADGTIAALHEHPRVTVLEVPSGTALAELDVDPDALASDVAWVGTPPRLLVVARYATHGTIDLLDPRGPQGPRTLAKLQLPSPIRLLAAVGSAALVVGPQSAAMLVASDSYLMPYQLPTPILPAAAGAAAGQLVVALAGSIEEWDPQSRMPKRRLRLPRTTTITAVGGSERLIWMTTQQEPARIDVIPLVNRGQPKAHDLPEPIAYVAGHPRVDLVACIGRASGRLYTVDLHGRAPLREIRASGLDRIDAAALVVGRTFGVLAAQAQRPIAFVPLDSGDISTSSRPGIVLPPTSDPAIKLPPADEPDEPARSAAPSGEADARGRRSVRAGLAGRLGRGPAPAPAPSAAGSSPGLAPPRPVPAASPPTPAPSPAPTPSAAAAARSSLPASLAVHRTPAGPLAPPAAPPSAPPKAAPPLPSGPAPSTGQRSGGWRERVRQHRQHVEPAAPAPAPAPAIAPTPAPASAPAPMGSPSRTQARASWRDDVVAWSRAVRGGAAPTAPAAPAIDDVLAQFELAPQLRPVLVMLYGAHLCGEHGAAPIDVARLLRHNWDEALGHGELAQRGVAEYIESRVALSPLILRALDELPP